METESMALKMPLTDEERSEFSRCENFIKDNLQTLFDVGKAFADIRDRKLYRETHRTFEDYCKERWQISRPRAYQLIDASVVQENLSTNVDKNIPLPTNEAQTRALKQVPVEKQPELWTKAVSQNNGHAPTGKQIIQVIETEFEEKKPNKPDTQTYEPEDLKSCQDCCYHGGGRKLIGWSQDEVVCNQFGKRPRPGKDRWPAEYCEGFRTKKNWEKMQPQPQPLPEPARIEAAQPEPELEPHERIAISACAFCCKENIPVIVGINDLGICRKCASKAQIALLHQDDPEVIAECQQMEEDIMSHGFEPRRTADLDKILRAGGLRIFRVSEYEKKIKEYTKAKSTIIEIQEAINWGSWKTFETFPTKKAMIERVQELARDDHNIFEGKAF